MATTDSHLKVKTKFRVSPNQYLMSILLWFHILNTVYSFIHHFLSEIINCLTFNNPWAALGNQNIGALISSGSTTGLRTERNQVNEINEGLCFATNAPVFVPEWYSLLNIPSLNDPLFSVRSVIIHFLNKLAIWNSKCTSVKNNVVEWWWLGSHMHGYMRAMSLQSCLSFCDPMN